MAIDSQEPPAGPVRFTRILPLAALDTAAQRHTGDLLATVLGPHSATPPHDLGTLVALDGSGRVIGAVSATRPDVGRMRLQGVCDLAPAVCEKSASISEIYAIAVVPAARRRGTARELISLLEADLAAAGTRMVVAFAWVRRDDRPDARRVFASLGYHDHGLIERFWFHAGPDLAPGTPGVGCPDCGAPCECSAAILTHVLC